MKPFAVENGGDLVVRCDVTNDRQIRFTGVEALIRCSLRRDGAGERGDRRKNHEKGNYEEDGFRHTFGHEQYLLC